MTKQISKVLVLTFIMLSQFSIVAQRSISSIQPLDDAQNHYKDLQLLDASKRSQYSDMDTLSFPAEMYNSIAILLAMSEPHYLTSSQVAFLKKSVEFPANSSEQTRSELDFLLDLQKNRTPEEVERVMYLAKIGYWPDANYLPTHPKYESNLKSLFFECREVIGEECTSSKYPYTSNLLQGIMKDMRIMEFAVKYNLLRARPYELEPKLEPLSIMGSPSFASGHTLWAYIQAYTWSELIPSKRKEFLAAAYELGLSREIMGVHYPSDEEAARQLSHRMLMLMWHTEKFQHDFILAKSEWE